MQTQAVQQILDAGAFLARAGLAPATSGNYSVRLMDERVLITVSGADKGRLQVTDTMLVDLAGEPLEKNKRPSAETLLHMALYRRFPQVGAVLHTHSMSAVLLSRHVAGGMLVLRGYELLKAFDGVRTHDLALPVPILENDQDIPALVHAADAALAELAHPIGYIIRGHGVYTWGGTMKDALRATEALEFLLQCEWESLKIRR